MVNVLMTIGGDIHHVFCESEDKDSFSGNIALIMLYVQQMLYAVDYLHRETGILHLDIKGKTIAWNVLHLSIRFLLQGRTLLYAMVGTE